jgi:diadenosine tetraphosphate (Ap4A) HIT family hydrolase
MLAALTQIWGKRMAQPVLCEGADLCQEIARSADTSFVRTYRGNPPSRLIFETSSFALIADMSPLMVGHLLLLPKIHYLSFSALMRIHFAELERLMPRISQFYMPTFGEPLVLEHGSADESDSNACVTHAHWHLVPVAGPDVESVISQDALPRTDLAGMAELGQPRWAGRSYYYTSYAGRHHVYEPSPSARRQYLRSVVGRVLSIDDPEWDYALVVRKEYLRETMDRVRHWFR